MTISLSLEEQKKIILDRMEESRRNYRSSLIQRDSIAKNSTVLLGNSGTFPRSNTFKFLMQYPYLLGIAVSAILVVSRKPLKNLLKRNLAFRTSMLANKVKILVVAALFRMFRSYIR